MLHVGWPRIWILDLDSEKMPSSISVYVRQGELKCGQQIEKFSHEFKKFSRVERKTFLVVAVTRDC